VGLIYGAMQTFDPYRTYWIRIIVSLLFYCYLNMLVNFYYSLVW